MTNEQKDISRVLAAAKLFMLFYLSDGVIRQPSDFDNDILRESIWPATLAILKGEQTVWNKTIFADALGDLIEEGMVDAWEDDRGWFYQYAK